MRNDVLFDIMLTILNKKIVTAKYLSNKYHMSLRSIYRYIDILSMSIPIATKPGKNGGIYILNTFNVNSIYFTDSEATALKNAIASIDNDILKTSLLNKLNITSVSQ